MAFLSEVIQWVQVYQLETTDPVEGGPTGVSNTPLKNLTDRTAWLKKHVDDLESGVFVIGIYAPINSANLTGSPTAPTPPLGNRTTRIATTAFVHGVAGSVLSKDVAGDQNITLTADEAGNGILVFTGALTGNIAVNVPATSRSWVVRNGTTGAFTLTVKTPAGTGVAVTQGRNIELFCDGTNVLASTTDFASPAMTGTPTAPTAAPGTATTQLATCAFVTAAIAALPAYPVTSVAGKTGAVSLVVGDVSGAAPLASPAFTGTPTAPTPDPADNSTKLATTEWVQGLLGDLPGSPVLSVNGKTGIVVLAVADISGAAPLASPALTGVPTAPTATGGTNTTQLATCAFVQTAIASLAPLASPGFSGTPTAPTPSQDDNSTRVSTTAYMQSQAYTVAPAMDGSASAGISPRWARGDHVHPTDTSRAPLASPAFTGVPTAPTASQDTNSTQLATCAFVLAQAGATTPAMDGSATAGTAVRFARSDHVHPTDTSRAPLASPAFTGTPTAPTPAAGNNSTQLATTAFVQQAVGSMSAPVTSVAGKTGAVSLVVGDVSGAAPLASPAFTGVPTAPTASQGTNTTQLATCAFVQTAIAGFAPINSPSFTGSPTAPTPSAGDSSTKIATTAFVQQNGMKNMQLISASTTFTVPAGVTRVKVTITGGGGGGGGKNAVAVGGGGGAGGTVIGFVSVTPGQSISVTIGAGGYGGNTGDGGNGGSSSFGPYMSAGGGNGGHSSSGDGGGGLGGGASGGTANILGGSGGDGAVGDLSLQGGHGGASWWGGGGRAGIGAGAVGQAFGSGGGGGWYNPTATGGAGASGVCLIEW